MTARFGRVRVVIAGAACFGIYAASVIAQPEEAETPPAVTENGDPQAEDGRPTREFSGDMVRRRIDERIEQLDRDRDLLRKAIERLDAGESPRRVFVSVASLLGNRERVSARQGGARGGPRFSTDAGSLDPATEAAMRTLIDTHLPMLSASLKKVDEEEGVDSDRSKALLARLQPRFMRVIEAQERDPAFADLLIHELKTGMTVVEWSRRLREAASNGTDDAETETYRKAMALALGAQFDARLRVEEYELSKRLEQMERRRDWLRDSIDDRESEIGNMTREMVERAKEQGRKRGGRRGDGPPPGGRHDDGPRDNRPGR